MFKLLLLAHGQEFNHRPGQLIIMHAPDADVQKVVNDLQVVNGVRTGLAAHRELSPPMRAWSFQFNVDHIDHEVMLAAVAAHPDIILAQNDHIVEFRGVPDDAGYSQQWHHQNIESEQAWEYTTGGITATGDTIVICMVEQTDLPHPDLIGNAWFNHAEIPDNGMDDDGNGYIDDHRGWDPLAGNDQVYGGWHGTPVAGMAGAKGNNGIGAAGACWNVKLMVVDFSGAQESEVLAAYTYPLIMRRRYNETNGAEGAFVVATNTSWGVSGVQPSSAPIWCAVYDTLGAAGILNCGATTNFNANVDEVGDLPTACPSDHLISVTATDVNDMRYYSGYGVQTIDVGAPGESVYTTYSNGGYGTMSGTSFASPLTAGVIGLLYGAPCISLMELVHQDPAAGALMVRDALFGGVDQGPTLLGQTVTGGRINSRKSMESLMSSCGSCPPPYALGAVVEGAFSVVQWSSSAQAFDVRYRPLGNSAWVEVFDIDGPQLLLADLLSCETYEFAVRAHCMDGVGEFSPSYVFTSGGCGNCLDLEYCGSGGGTTAFEHIASVTIGTFTNSSGNDGGFGDYTHLPVDLTIGSSYPITVTPGFSNGMTFLEFVKVYIDLDQDGEFSGTDELVFAPVSSTSAMSGSITIPQTTAEGSTRMRVVLRDQAGQTTPCGLNNGYGETEDYCVTLASLNTGMLEKEPGDLLVLFPQPADQQLNIRWREGEGSAIVLVHDGIGRLVLKESLREDHSFLDIAALPAGVYSMTLVPGINEPQRARFVIAR